MEHDAVKSVAECLIAGCLHPKRRFLPVRADGGERFTQRDLLSVYVVGAGGVPQHEATFGCGTVRRRHPEFGHRQVNPAGILQQIRLLHVRPGGFGIEGETGCVGQFAPVGVVVICNQIVDRQLVIFLDVGGNLLVANHPPRQHGQVGQQIVSPAFLELLRERSWSRSDYRPPSYPLQ